MIDIRSIKTAAIIFCIIFLALFSYEAKSEASAEYEFKRVDNIAEQKKFLVKLKEDKNKVDMVIISTKELINRSRNRAYLPELYIRLSELYIEKARISYFINKTESNGNQTDLDKLETNNLKKQAIEIYLRLLGNFPEFEDRDKVHFFLAHEYRELGQNDEMIKQYRAIIIKHPKSPYAAESYLLLGDYFFNMKQDLEMAKKYYKAVLKYPKSPSIGIARYKLAWCHINVQEFKKAILLFEKLLVSEFHEDTDIDTYKKVDIKLESLIDMAFCFTEAYKDKTPTQPIEYFKKYSWSRPVYALVLEKIGYRYYIKKKWSHSVEIYRQLAMLNHDAEKLLEYSGYIFECVKATGDFKNAVHDMAYIIKALKEQKYSIHFTDEVKEKNNTDFELYARDIVTHIHQKARKRKSVQDFKYAADSYKLYIDFFNQSPVLKEMELNYAEALFSSEQFIDAGKQYEKLAGSIVVAKNKKGKSQAADKKIANNLNDKEEKLYSAVLSYYSALKAKEELDYYQIAYARGGLKTTGKNYAKEFPLSSKVPEILFNVAWITYDEGKYDEAIAEFAKFVNKYPTGKEAKVAIHLAMDAYNMKEDFEGLIQYGKKIAANKQIDYKLRNEVAAIVKGTENKVISNLTVAAVNDWEKGRNDLENFAAQNSSSVMGEQALRALIVSSKQKGDMEVLFSASSKLIDLYPSSKGIKGAMGDVIDATSKASQFRLTAKYLEKFASKFSNQKAAGEFFFQAGKIRESLGQHKQAIKNYRQYLKYSSLKKSPMVEETIFLIAHNADQTEDFDFAAEFLVNNRKYLSSTGKVKADAMIADFYFESKNFAKALKYKKRAKSSFKPTLARKDGEINMKMAQMMYNGTDRSYDKYMDMQLAKKIDNKVVAAKAKLLEKLEKTYYSIMQYKSPEWALKACYRSYEINKEFARFLKAAPLPALSPEQKQQYIQLIAQKSDGYATKAYQYLETCAKQAHKWELCDPQLVEYYNSLSDYNYNGRIKKSRSFAGLASSVEIVEQSLKDESLKNLHYRLMKSPDNADLLLELANAYTKKGDFDLSVLITQKILGEKNKVSKQIKAIAYNTLGVSNLLNGDDQTAKDAFKKALEIDSEHIGARINLAGLYQHYGHIEKADNIYKKLADSKGKENITSIVHPRAQEFYYAHFKKSKN